MPAAPFQQLSATPHLPPLMVQVLTKGTPSQGMWMRFHAMDELEADPFLLPDMDRPLHA